MPFTNLNLITVTGKFILLNGANAVGSVSFAADQTLIDSVANEIIVPVEITANLVNGAFSLPLPSTNDPDLAPTGWTYTVTETIANARTKRVYQIQLPYNAAGGTLDLADIVPVAGVEVVSQYALVGHTHTGLGLETPVVLQPDVVGETPLQLKALSGQTAPFLTVTDHSDNIKLQITKDHDVRWMNPDGTAYNIASFDAPWTNGPPGEPTYTDSVAVFGYNVGPGGTAIDGAKAAAWLQFESRFYQTFLDGSINFGSEIHFNFRIPSGAGGVPRPWGASINHITGAIGHGVRGSVAWEKSDGSGVSMQLSEANNLLSFADSLSLSFSPTLTTDATIDIGGRAGLAPSILVFAGATQTQDLLALRTPANATAMQVKVGGEVNVGAAGLVVNFSQNDGAAITAQPPANANAILAGRARNGQTGDLISLWNFDLTTYLFAIDKDGYPVVRSPNGTRWKVSVDDDGLLSTVSV